MYNNKKSNRDILSAQHYSASHYSDSMQIYDTKIAFHKSGFWFEFSIKPTELSREYRILLVYIQGWQPYVYVIYPNIVEISKDRELPHVYSSKNQQLCLTYPSNNEWTNKSSIVDTYIPWISFWLYYFEEWLLTDDWKGGGKHPEPPKENSLPSKKKRLEKKRKTTRLEKINKIYHARKTKYLQHLESQI